MVPSSIDPFPKHEIVNLAITPKAHSSSPEPPVLGTSPVQTHTRRIARKPTKPPTNPQKSAVDIDIRNEIDLIEETQKRKMSVAEDFRNTEEKFDNQNNEEELFSHSEVKEIIKSNDNEEFEKLFPNIEETVMPPNKDSTNDIIKMQKKGRQL